MKRRGAIIGIVGSTRSGKTFLSKKLAKHFRAHLLFEDIKLFPPRILEDIRKNIRSFERVLWFHTDLVDKYLRAEALKAKGKMVVLDTFWLTERPYVDVFLKGFERSIARKICALDIKLFEWPDVVIFLKTSEEGVRKFIRRGGRKFDNSEKYIRTQALPVHRMHDKFFSRSDIARRIMTVDRTHLDFAKESDFKSLVRKIETVLKRKRRR